MWGSRHSRFTCTPLSIGFVRSQYRVSTSALLMSRERQKGSFQLHHLYVTSACITLSLHMLFCDTLASCTTTGRSNVMASPEVTMRASKELLDSPVLPFRVTTVLRNEVNSRRCFLQNRRRHIGARRCREQWLVGHSNQESSPTFIKYREKRRINKNVLKR